MASALVGPVPVTAITALSGIGVADRRARTSAGESPVLRATGSTTSGATIARL